MPRRRKTASSPWCRVVLAGLFLGGFHAQVCCYNRPVNLPQYPYFVCGLASIYVCVSSSLSSQPTQPHRKKEAEESPTVGSVHAAPTYSASVYESCNIL